MQVRRRVRRHLAAVRREVARLAAIAEKHAAEAEKPRASAKFRPLTEAETEAILGGELLAALALRRPNSLAM